MNGDIYAIAFILGCVCGPHMRNAVKSLTNERETIYVVRYGPKNLSALPIILLFRNVRDAQNYCDEHATENFECVYWPETL